jgi:integrase
MPHADLDAAFVRSVEIPPKGKVDYYSNEITGFILEVRSTGGKTYYVRYRDPHGKQRQIKIGDAQSVSYDRARQAAERLRSRVVLGESPIEEKKVKRTIPTIAELYRDTYLPHQQQTRRNMGSDFSFWKVHLLPKFGHLHLDELTQQDVIDAQMEMRQAGYAPGTANKWIVQLRYAYVVGKRFAVPGSEKNPAAGIKQFQVEGRERFLSSDETERLRVAVERSENTQLKYVIGLLLMLGCRKRELLDARWEQFDVERRTWRIPLAKSGKARHVPLSLATIAFLEKLPRWEGVPWVVPNPYTFKPFTGINESWKTALSRANLKGVRIHDLRHTFASNLVNAGHSLFVVSKALGHANIQQSSRYSHLSDDTLLAAADAAGNAMGAAWTEVKQAPAQP